MKHSRRLVTAPILRAPDWSITFHVHIDASKIAIGAVLCQPGEHNLDFPVSFASRQLTEAEMNYSTTEREGLAMVYAVKKFRHYLLATPFTFFVDHQALLYLVNKPCATGRIARWLLLLLEFDFSVVVRKGKQHFMADHLSRVPSGEKVVGIDDQLLDAYLFCLEQEAQLFKADLTPHWADDIIHLLENGLPERPIEKARLTRLLIKTRPYQLIAGQLYRLGQDGLLRRCICEHEIEDALQEAHGGIAGGHFDATATARKVLQAQLWWPTLFKDAARFVKHCDECQRTKLPIRKDKMELTPIIARQPFEKWGIDFMGPITPAAQYSQARYIIVATDYMTKWAEARATRKNDARTTARFLWE